MLHALQFIATLFAALFAGAALFTFIVIMPTNHKLLAPGRDLSSPETRALLESWGKLHAVRTGLSLLATVLFIGLLCGA
jgi:anthrone oxygenase-like protein